MLLLLLLLFVANTYYYYDGILKNTVGGKIDSVAEQLGAEVHARPRPSIRPTLQACMLAGRSE